MVGLRRPQRASSDYAGGHGHAQDLRHRPRRRRGQATHAPHGGPRQARGAVRRAVPTHRLRAVEPHQLGAAPDRRAHAVQVAQPRPPRVADLAPVRPAELLRRLRARAAAARQALVLRLGRRHPAEPQPHLRREARHRRRRRRRPRLPHGLQPDDRRAHRVGPGGDRRRDPPADLARRPVRRDRGRRRRTRPHRRVPREAEGPRRPRRLARTRCSPRWATTSSTPTCSSTPCCATASAPTRTTTWAATSSPTSSTQGDAGVYDLKRNEVPGSTDRDRYYWRDVGTIDSFFEAHQDLISALPVFNLYNREWPIFSQQLNSPPAKFVRDARGSLGTVIDSIVSLGSRHLGRAHRAQRARPVGDRRLGRAGGRLDPLRPRAHRRRRRRCSALSSTRRSSSRPARASASTAPKTGHAASPSPTPASRSSARAPGFGPTRDRHGIGPRERPPRRARRRLDPHPRRGHRAARGCRGQPRASSPRSPSARCTASSTSPRACASASRRSRDSPSPSSSRSRARMTPTPGVPELIAGVHAAGGRVGVVSGGFHELLDPLAAAARPRLLARQPARGRRRPAHRSRRSAPIVDAARRRPRRSRSGRRRAASASIARSPSATAPTTSRCSAGRGSASPSAPSRSCASERMSRSTRPTSAGAPAAGPARLSGRRASTSPSVWELPPNPDRVAEPDVRMTPCPDASSHVHCPQPHWVHFSPFPARMRPSQSRWHRQVRRGRSSTVIASPRRVPARGHRDRRTRHRVLRIPGGRRHLRRRRPDRARVRSSARVPTRPPPA